MREFASGSTSKSVVGFSGALHELSNEKSLLLQSGAVMDRADGHIKWRSMETLGGEKAETRTPLERKRLTASSTGRKSTLHAAPVLNTFRSGSYTGAS